MLGMFKPLSVSLEKKGNAAVCHLLPQLLRLCTKVIRKPAEHAAAHSGRTVADIANKMKKSASDVSQLVTPLQEAIISKILAGFWGEKGTHNKLGGRVNNFSTVFAWATCSGVYPTILQKWDDRITKPLHALNELGYALQTTSQTVVAYKEDILGV